MLRGRPADGGGRATGDVPTLFRYRDRAAFIAVLLDPPAPNERLIRAMAAHRRLIAS